MLGVAQCFEMQFSSTHCQDSLYVMLSIGALKDKLIELDNKYLTLTISNMLSFEEAL